jgi:FkbM family methyltransferase
MDWKSWLKLTPVYDLFGKRSFSQSGEDVVVDSILNKQKNGFYVDIGAFHPKVFSNTYLFYKRGWRGVCVEPNPEAKWKFKMVRPRDVFVNVGVIPRTQNDELTYFVFDEGATNTFSAEVAEENKKVGRKLIKTIRIPVMEINSLLKKYVPEKQKIDLLSIDVEGMDEAILKSIDWKKWKPEVVVCEEIRRTQELKNAKYCRHCEAHSAVAVQKLTGCRLPRRDYTSRNDGGQLADFMFDKGYEMVGKTGYSVIYRKSRLGKK